MSEHKHTPGPWVYTVRANHRETGSMHYDIENPTFDGPCECGAKHPPGRLIAWLSGGLGEASLDRVRFRHDPATEADARLIAAAPDLLLAAQTLVALLDHGARIVGNKAQGLAEARLRDAIAKAEGR